MNDSSTRLNKYLALQLGISRREADALIEHGHVRINGTVAPLGARTKDDDIVEVKGKRIESTTAYQYILLHKPTGYVCSRRAQGAIPTIYSLLPSKFHGLKSVGRLDKNSSGLVLLTNDGDFAYQMTHPKFRKVKVYEVSLNIPLEPLHQQMISDLGITLDDGLSKLGLERLDDSRCHWRVTMSEGRNRQIRRTFHALGYTVETLHRTHFGTYILGSLAPGQWEILKAPTQ